MKIKKGRAVIKRHQKRNVFNTVSTQQYVEACTEVGFGPELHPDLEKCIDGSFSVVCTTNMVEEIVGMERTTRRPCLAQSSAPQQDLSVTSWQARC